MNMTNKLKFSFLVLVIGYFHLIWHCECMNIVMATTATPASAFQSRKLSDESMESVTRDSNSLNGPKDLLKHEKLKEPNFPQFTEPPAPVYITNAPPVRQSHTLGFPLRNYQPINNTQLQQLQQMHMQNQFEQQQQYQQMMMTTLLPPNYVPSERHNFMGMFPHQPKPPQSFQELMNMPLNMANLRGIKSSIMTFVYKVQNFMNYVLSFFAPGES